MGCSDHVEKLIRVVLIARVLLVLGMLLVGIAIAAKLDGAEYLSATLGEDDFEIVACRVVHYDSDWEMSVDGPSMGGGEIWSTQVSVTVPPIRHAESDDDFASFAPLPGCELPGCESCGCEVSCCDFCFTNAELLSSCLHAWCHEAGLSACRRAIADPNREDPQMPRGCFYDEDVSRDINNSVAEAESREDGFSSDDWDDYRYSPRPEVCQEVAEWFSSSDSVAYLPFSGEPFHWLTGLPVGDLPWYCSYTAANHILMEPNDKVWAFFLLLPMCIWAVLRLLGIASEAYTMRHKPGAISDFVNFVVSTIVAGNMILPYTSMEFAESKGDVVFISQNEITNTFAAALGIPLTMIMACFTWCNVKGAFETGGSPLWMEGRFGFKEGKRTFGRSSSNSGCCCCWIFACSTIYLCFTALMFVAAAGTLSFGLLIRFSVHWPGIDLSMAITSARVLSFLLFISDVLLQLGKQMARIQKKLGAHGRQIEAPTTC